MNRTKHCEAFDLQPSALFFVQAFHRVLFEPIEFQRLRLMDHFADNETHDNNEKTRPNNEPRETSGSPRGAVHDKKRRGDVSNSKYLRCENCTRHKIVTQNAQQ